MSFLIGFSFIILLSMFTILLWFIARLLPKEFALTTIALLIFGDAMFVGLWYFSLVDIVEVVKQFKLGIAGAFCAASFGRALYFMLSYEKV